MNISEVIKAATAESHQKLEKLVVSQIHALRTRQDYIRLLGFFYNYFGSVELLIREQITPEFLPDIDERRRIKLLSRDLLSLKAELPPGTESTLLPMIQNRYRAFGALYVVEGSSLGGIHIASMIRKQLPQFSAACLYFEGYGEQTVNMWKQFKIILDNLSGDEDSVDEIISGAEETFLKFAEWIYLNIKSKVQI